jgi:sugar O-acyltransferase (sialic acid O-acetyltransferase NeuD family)
MLATRTRLIIIGAGRHGSEVQAYVKDLLRSGWNGDLLGFLDDTRRRGLYRGLNVLGPLEQFADAPPKFFRGLQYITAIGDNTGRQHVIGRFETLYGKRMTAWTLMHTTAWTGDDVVIGEGTLVAPGVIVTTRARIGRHCILNIKSSVSHDCVIGDYVSINPGATICGNCRIGTGAFIGTGATVINGVEIGEGAIIGGGAAVVKDIPPNVTAVGVPARVIKRH